MDIGIDSSQFKVILGGILVIVTIIIIVIVVNAFGGGGIGIRPTTTPTPTTILTSIPFSGFSDNITLENLLFNNESAVKLPGSSMTVYSANQIDPTYVARQLHMTKNVATGIFSNSSYYLSVQRTSFSIVSINGPTNGSISAASAVDDLKNYLKTNLIVDTNEMNFSVSQSGNIFTVNVSNKVTSYKVISLSSTPDVSANISTSGQILTVVMNNMFYGLKRIDDYPISFNPTADVYSTGFYSSDVPRSQNIPQINNSNIDLSSSQVGYYFDYQTGYLYPVLFINESIATADTGASYNTRMMVMLVSANDLSDVPSDRSTQCDSGCPQQY